MRLAAPTAAEPHAPTIAADRWSGREILHNLEIRLHGAESWAILKALGEALPYRVRGVLSVILSPRFGGESFV